jgi:biopolymer transport protein ExbD
VRLSNRRLEDPEINLISLIDILLLVLIFFMVSSTFIEEGRLRVRLPSATELPQRQQGAEPIVVVVTEGGVYRVNDRDLVNASIDTLRAAVLKVAGNDRSANITVRADGRATHQSVVQALDVLGRLGFSQISIATVDPQTMGGNAP